MCPNGNDINLAYTVVVCVFRVFCCCCCSFSISLAINFVSKSRLGLAIAICGHAKLVNFSQKQKCMYVSIILLRKP